MRYQGKAIGGPRDGLTLSANQPSIRCVIDGPQPFAAPPADVRNTGSLGTIEQFVYQWCPIAAEEGFWWPEGKIDGDEVMRVLLKGYRGQIDVPEAPPVLPI